MACSCCLNKLIPSFIQRVASSTTLRSVNGERFTRNDSSTLVITLRRCDPAAVLLVRPASRSFAGLRSELLT